MKFLVALVVLLNCMQSAFSEGTPRIVDISEDQVKGVGSSVNFSCSVQNSGAHKVTWSKLGNNGGLGDLLISTNSDDAIVISDKYAVAAFSDLLTTKYVLQIRDLKETDAGFYECQISISTKRRVAAQTELQICKTPIVGSDESTLAPKISDMPEREVKYTGDTVEFVCAVENNQNLHPVLWIKGNTSNVNELPMIISANSHLILRNTRVSVLYDSAYPNNYTLQIRNIQKTDVGIYACLVPTSATETTLAQVELQIDENEVSRITRISPDQLYKTAGSEIKFDCKVENRKGYPVLWVKMSDDDNALIISYKTMIVTPSEKYAVTYDQKTSTYTLKVKDVGYSDAGTYQCRIDTSGNKIVSAEVRLSVFSAIDTTTLNFENLSDNNDDEY